MDQVPTFPMDRVVVPILENNLDVDIRPSPRGTGFFIGPNPMLVTCYHVVKDVTGELGISPIHTVPDLYPAKVIATDPSTDLAILEVPGYQPPNVLPLSADTDHHGNRLVVCHEFSNTRKGVDKTVLSSGSRVGNIIRSIKRYDLANVGEINALELSFPALKGASGAPIMANDGNYAVLGIVVGNVEHELLPVQIETILTDANDLLEERKYMLPQGIAINVSHLKEFLRREGFL